MWRKKIELLCNMFSSWISSTRLTSYHSENKWPAFYWNLAVLRRLRKYIGPSFLWILITTSRMLVLILTLAFVGNFFLCTFAATFFAYYVCFSSTYIYTCLCTVIILRITMCIHYYSSTYLGILSINTSFRSSGEY